ncbi:hypothetical protein KY346_06000 [Candidatus Woesearchaeota archaeon]|nr:hypothetical protein [Candidatus Woesearchaeota archaeon]
MEIPEIPKTLDYVVFRSGPRRSQTQVHALLEAGGPEAMLYDEAKKIGGKTEEMVFTYLQVYAAYKNRNKPRNLITDIPKIVTGMQIAHTLDLIKDVRLIRQRNGCGSWDNLLEVFEKNKERPAYKLAGQSDTEKQRILELKALEEKNDLNLADYCIVL